ncbi:MAG TPA: hypothetical protein VH988_17400 [Thermoanaerobaculia bacterium]|jgi:hypothetical protein|nr:hypothetical protein [Thermoanaerobaculia bacterium]
MKLRTQIALAFLLLAVLPLGGIVLYSYVSSERAFRQAVWSETQALTDEMTDRLAATRQTIRDRITRLGTIDDASPDAVKSALDRISSAELPFVDSLELLPGKIAAGDGKGQEGQEAQRTTFEQVVIHVHSQMASVARQVVMQQEQERQQEQEAAARREESKRLVGDLSCPLTNKGEVIGRINPHVSAEAFLQDVFAVRREQGEVPFALDAKGLLYVSRPEDRTRLSAVPVSCDPKVQARQLRPTWVVVTKTPRAASASASRGRSASRSPRCAARRCATSPMASVWSASASLASFRSPDG